MKLSDILETISIHTDTEGGEVGSGTSLGCRQTDRELYKQASRYGRGTNYRKARAIARMAKKKAEQEDTTSVDMEAEIGPDFNQLYIR